VNGQQISFHQVARRQGPGGNHDQDLVKISGNDVLALALIRPYKIIFTWKYGFYYQGVIIGALYQNPIAAKWPSDLAPEFARPSLTSRQQYNTLAAIGHQYQGLGTGFGCHFVYLMVSIRLLYL
jgi:hypothetical protein